MKNRNISFEYPKKSLLKSSYPQKILAEIFLPPKNPEIENCKPPKILRSSLSLEIRRTPLRTQMADDGSVNVCIWCLTHFGECCFFLSKDELHLPVEVTHGYVGKFFIKQEHRWISVTIVRCQPHKVSHKVLFFFLKSCISSYFFNSTVEALLATTLVSDQL